MNPFILLVLAIFSLVPERAAGDIIRRATIPAFLFGTWAENSEQCISKDKSNVVIESLRYGDEVEAAQCGGLLRRQARMGQNYAVHGLCTSAADQAKTQIVNIIIRPQGNDRASMGRSFADLKTYQRCPE